MTLLIGCILDSVEIGCILDSVEGLHHERAEFDQDILISGLDHASVEWLHHERA